MAISRRRSRVPRRSVTTATKANRTRRSSLRFLFAGKKWWGTEAEENREERGFQVIRGKSTRKRLKRNAGAQRLLGAALSAFLTIVLLLAAKVPSARAQAPEGPAPAPTAPPPQA